MSGELDIFDNYAISVADRSRLCDKIACHNLYILPLAINPIHLYDRGVKSKSYCEMPRRVAGRVYKIPTASKIQVVTKRVYECRPFLLVSSLLCKLAFSQENVLPYTVQTYPSVWKDMILQTLVYSVDRSPFCDRSHVTIS